MKKLYVGNVAYKSTQHDIRTYFESIGPVQEVDIILEKETQQPRGFCFVTMVNEADAQRAIEQLDRQEFDGRRLVVNLAREREERGGDRRDRRSRDRY